MVKVLLILLYLFKGEVVLEQKGFNDAESCSTALEIRVATLALHPGFDGLLTVGCLYLAQDQTSFRQAEK